jgi:hypothetical protein
MVAAFALGGCVWIDGEGEPVSEGESTATSAGTGGQSGVLGPILPSGSGGNRAEVLMMGRSVMYDWFDHDGWDGRNELRRGDYWFFYGQLDTPPTIADSAVNYIDQVPDGTVLFFKLCFADFYAETEQDIANGLEENVGYVEEVVAAASERDMALILGNALPQVRSYTTPELVKLHIAYNEELDRIAAENDNVYVFDQWSVLANQQDGTLTKGFAVSPDDAHLSDPAYAELTPRLIELLDQITAE